MNTFTSTSIVTRLAHLLVACCLVMVVGCRTIHPIPATPLQVSGVFTHVSGMQLPESIAGFKRGAVTTYERDNLDVSAGYRKGLLTPLEATIYIYPAPSLTSIGSRQEVIDDARATLFA